MKTPDRPARKTKTSVSLEEPGHFEVIKRFLEAKNEERILACLERMEKKKKLIGLGKNAEVFVVENEPMFEKLCAKKVKKLPEVKINSIDIEFDFQEKVSELGIATPRNVMMVRNTETREEYIIMEKIDGVSAGDAMDPKSTMLLPDTYDHDEFFRKLRAMVEKMHENRIYHRDLHEGNVMIDKNGNPVIIDFGAATMGYGDEEDIYRGEGYVLQNQRGDYKYTESMLPKDESMIIGLEIKMRKFKKS